MQPGVSGLFQSYKHGGGQQPLLGRTVRDVLDQAVARWRLSSLVEALEARGYDWVRERYGIEEVLDGQPANSR